MQLTVAVELEEGISEKAKGFIGMFWKLRFGSFLI